MICKTYRQLCPPMPSASADERTIELSKVNVTVDGHLLALLLSRPWCMKENEEKVQTYVIETRKYFVLRSCTRVSSALFALIAQRLQKIYHK